MGCPRCSSNDLKIRQATGLEFIVLLFITLRKYTCRRCGTTFRAPDRRKQSRELGPDARRAANQTAGV